MRKGKRLSNHPRKLADQIGVLALVFSLDSIFQLRRVSCLSAQGQGVVPFSLTHIPKQDSDSPRSERWLRASNSDSRPVTRFQGSPKPALGTRCPVPQPPTAPKYKAASFRDPATFPRTLPAATRLETRDSVDQRKRDHT